MGYGTSDARGYVNARAIREAKAKADERIDRSKATPEQSEWMAANGLNDDDRAERQAWAREVAASKLTARGTLSTRARKRRA